MLSLVDAQRMGGVDEGDGKASPGFGGDHRSIGKVSVDDIGQTAQTSQMRAKSLGKGGQIVRQRFLFQVAAIFGGDPVDGEGGGQPLAGAGMIQRKPRAFEQTGDDGYLIHININGLSLRCIKNIGDMSARVGRNPVMHGWRFQAAAKCQMQNEQCRPFRYENDNDINIDWVQGAGGKIGTKRYPAPILILINSDRP